VELIPTHPPARNTNSPVEERALRDQLALLQARYDYAPLTDWPAVLDGARALLAVAVGEVTPLDAFDRLCREADRKAAARKKNPKLERLRELMADDVSLERAWHELCDRRPAPEMTIKAVKQAVRDRGVAALSEPSTRGRLQKCDADARKRFDVWLSDFKARIAA
jgi:hypothetical protein